MFENVQQAIDWVITQRKGENKPRTNFRDYMAYLGNPQYQLKCLHVAGTNGKGSTTNYLRSILQTAGYKVGSFTSPHLVTHLDRIRINDENIPEDYFLQIVNEKQAEWMSWGLSMFQIDTVIAVTYFLEEKCDIAVFEVGLGGRYDSTNVIKPIGAVITNIEMDHMAILGDTIGEIACQKAGIIKPGIPVVTFEKKEEALAVFKKVAAEEKAEIIEVQPVGNLAISDHIEFDYLSVHYSLPTIAGYQVLNASAAITLIDYLNRKGQLAVSKGQLQQGVQTFWNGRFEKVSEEPLVIVDGAHNENGIEGCCDAIDNLHEEVVIVFSALADKNYSRMLEKLLTKGEVIVTQFESRRSTTARQLAMGYDVKVIEDWQKAIDYACSLGKAVIITGSLYFISMVREYFGKH